MGTAFSDGCGLFQLDNVLCHKAKVVQEWFEEHYGFEALTWPPDSADLDPIKHFWDVQDKKFRSMETPSHKLQDLKDLLLTDLLPDTKCTFRRQAESMPPGVRAGLAAKGGPTL